jgi:hypothetical protein
MNQVINELPELEGDLIEILGRPNFQCAALANALRLKGQDIPFKSEREQAAVLHFTLNHFLKDKENWRRLCQEDLGRGFQQHNGRMAFGNVEHVGTACSLIGVTVMGQESETFKYEAFNVKAIFKQPYVLEEGIFFLDDTHAARAIVKNMKAGEEFDTSKLPEGWMNYDQYLAKLEEQYRKPGALNQVAAYPETVYQRDAEDKLVMVDGCPVVLHNKGDAIESPKD